MSEKTVTRRSLLLGLGAAAAASTPLFHSRRVLAGGNMNLEIPKRILFIWAGSGGFPGMWEPRASPGQAEPTLTDWALGPLHAALEPYKSRLTYFENLDMVSRSFDPIPGANAHIDAATHALTGNTRRTASLPGSISIDQFIAQRLNTPAPVTRLPTLDLLCTEFWNGDPNLNWVSSDDRGNTVPQIWNPRGAYLRAFPDPEPSTMMNNTAGSRRARVAAYLANRFSTLNPRLSGAERMMLDEHRTALADLQRRLQLSGGTGREAARPPASTFDAVPPGSTTGSLWGPWHANQAGNWALCTRLNLTVAISALHADVTRVATLQLQDPPAIDFGYTDGMYAGVTTTDAHDLIHKVMNPMDPLSRDTAARETIRRELAMHVQMFALALEQLAMRTEPDGSSLLDHTLVVMVGQIADGSHATDRLPWIVAGNADGYFRTGRYIRHGRSGTGGRPHNDLFVSLANAMDINVTTFGNPSACTGPIAEMR
jgi:hypothetical protein